MHVECRGDSPTVSFLLESEKGKGFTFRDVQANLPYRGYTSFHFKNMFLHS